MCTHKSQKPLNKNMFSAPIYLLLTISIVTKYADCYVVSDNSASMRNVAKSQADDTQTAYSDGNNNGNNGNNDVIDNHIRTSTINVTAIDNVMEMPKPNVAVDYSTFRANRDAIDALAEVETGRKKSYGGGGGKYGKYTKVGKGGGKKKKYKWLWPVLIGVALSKLLLFPLFVKTVTFLSSAAFVLSKMSLLTSLILGLKFFLANTNQNNESKVEIVHVPLKKYSNDWDRETSESKYHNIIADNVYEHELRPTRYVL